MKKIPNWQSYAYTFPNVAYLAFMRLENEDEERLAYQPLPLMHQDVTHINPIITQIEAQFDGGDSVYISEILLILEIKYIRKLALSKSAWQQAQISLEEAQRQLELLKCLTDPQWYHLIAFPVSKSDSQELFEAPLLVYQSTPDQEVKRMFPLLNIQVDPEAKYAARYAPSSRFGYNWQTSSIIDFISSDAV